MAQAPTEPNPGSAELQAHLQSIVATGSIDAKIWATLIPDVLIRLNYIVYHVYPATPRKPRSKTVLRLPQIRQELVKKSEGDAIKQQDGVQQEAHESTDTQGPSPSQQVLQNGREGRSTIPSPSRTDSASPVGQPTRTSDRSPAMKMLSMTIEDTLKTRFAQSPPWTVQRMSELLLDPQRGNKSLGSFLRSLDAVLSANSCMSAFPLSKAVPSDGQDSLAGSTIDRPGVIRTGLSQSLNDTSISSDVDPSSDEAIGGALLTPIPWLKRQPLHDASAGEEELDGVRMQSSPPNAEYTSLLETLDSKHVSRRQGSLRKRDEDLITQLGSPPRDPSEIQPEDHKPSVTSSEAASLSPMSRAAGAIGQGELLRMEQEAGVIPATQGSRSAQAQSTGGTTVATDEHGIVHTDADEQPHARGPNEVGVEDMGPQPTGSPSLSTTPDKLAMPKSPSSISPHSFGNGSPSSQIRTEGSALSTLLPIPSNPSELSHGKGNQAARTTTQELRTNSNINVGGFDVEKALGRHITRSPQDPTQEPGRAELAIQGLERRRENKKDARPQQDKASESLGLSQGSPHLDERAQRRERERERSHERKTSGRRSSTRNLRESSREDRQRSTLRRRSQSLSPAREHNAGARRGRELTPTKGADDADASKAVGQEERTKTTAEDVTTTAGIVDDTDGMEGIERTG